MSMPTDVTIPSPPGFYALQLDENYNTIRIAIICWRLINDMKQDFYSCRSRVPITLNQGCAPRHGVDVQFSILQPDGTVFVTGSDLFFDSVEEWRGYEMSEVQVHAS